VLSTEVAWIKSNRARGIVTTACSPIGMPISIENRTKKIPPSDRPCRLIGVKHVLTDKVLNGRAKIVMTAETKRIDDEQSLP
jgi:hypothetical protein